MRQSVEAGTGDKAVEPAARKPAPLCDDMPADFMSFVRSALHAVNKKLDNVYTYTQYSDSVNFQVMTITQRDQH